MRFMNESVPEDVVDTLSNSPRHSASAALPTNWLTIYALETIDPMVDSSVWMIPLARDLA